MSVLIFVWFVLVELGVLLVLRDIILLVVFVRDVMMSFVWSVIRIIV